MEIVDFKKGFFYWIDKGVIRSANNGKFLPKGKIAIRVDKNFSGSTYTFIPARDKDEATHVERIEEITPLVQMILAVEGTKTGTTKTGFAVEKVDDNIVAIFPRGYRPTEEDKEAFSKTIVNWDGPDEGEEPEEDEPKSDDKATKSDDKSKDDKSDDKSKSDDDKSKDDKSDDKSKSDDKATKSDDKSKDDKSDDKSKDDKSKDDKSDDKATKSDDDKSTKADDDKDDDKATKPVSDPPSTSAASTFNAYKLVEALYAGKITPEQAASLLIPDPGDPIMLYAGSNEGEDD